MTADECWQTRLPPDCVTYRRMILRRNGRKCKRVTHKGIGNFDLLPTVSSNSHSTREKRSTSEEERHETGASSKTHAPTYTKNERPAPALRMRSATHRALACRWHLGTFPIHYRFLHSIGLQNYLDDLKLLTKKKTSPTESTKLRIALRVISSIPEQELPTVNHD